MQQSGIITIKVGDKVIKARGVFAYPAPLDRTPRHGLKKKKEQHNVTTANQ